MQYQTVSWETNTKRGESMTHLRDLYHTLCGVDTYDKRGVVVHRPYPPALVECSKCRSKLAALRRRQQAREAGVTEQELTVSQRRTLTYLARDRAKAFFWSDGLKYHTTVEGAGWKADTRRDTLRVLERLGLVDQRDHIDQKVWEITEQGRKLAALISEGKV